MAHSLSFRLLYRAIFIYFCLIFACFYPHGGGLGYDSWEDKTKLKILKDEFKGKPLNDVFLKQEGYVLNLRTENAKQVDAGVARKKVDRSKMVRKGKFVNFERVAIFENQKE